MKALILCYKRCSTCRKAMKFLEQNNIAYDFRDIITDNPNKQELYKWVEQSGLPIKRFFNTSGVVYRELNLKDKLDKMSFEEKIDLLASDGRLIRRPILIHDHNVVVGFKEEEYIKLIP